MNNNLHVPSSFTKCLWLTALAMSLLSNPVSSVPTAPVEKTTIVSTVGGSDSWYAPDRGYYLKTVTVYRGSATGNMNGLSMEFCPASGSCVTNFYGQSTSGTANSLSITQIVTQVKFCCVAVLSAKGVNYMIFTLLDGSTI
jgi:hypothetical protein